MAVEFSVTLSRPEMPSGLGFRLFSVADCPSVICEIIENTPAAECAKIEVGDIIIKINNEDVRKCTIKEVLKCLSLAQNPINLKLVRDPAIKKKAHDKLAEDENSSQLFLRDIDSPPRPPQHHGITTSIDTEDEDISSSCNTLLNTNIKPLEMEEKRVSWTYNAGHVPDETSASCNSLQKVISPTSPTSISSSIMSSPLDWRRHQALDMASAVRQAKHLFYLEGFKKSDVSRHLSKNNEFSRAVAEEYFKYFDFKGNSLDLALRNFLKQFSLTGETQERERVLVHFSKRFLDCNPQCKNSQDAVHKLTCAIMQLNTDLHGQMIGRKMTCNEFIENLDGLNDNEHFPRDALKLLYMAIKSYPLEWASDDDLDENQLKNAIASQPIDSLGNKIPGQIGKSGGSYEENVMTQALEYKKGYVKRKCCKESNGKKTARGKRGWKMYYCTLHDLILYFHKDNSGKSQISDDSIDIHHGLATKAIDYTKKQHVFRLVTAGQAEYLFETCDSRELESWINTINFICASFSSPRLLWPLLPSAPTKLNLRAQLRGHEYTLRQLEVQLKIHKKKPPEHGTKNNTLQFYKEKESNLLEEYKRYETYVYLLRSKIQHPESDSSTGLMETGDEAEVVSVDDTSSLPISNRNIDA